MTRDETVALFLLGREAWNAWAERMLAQRKALEDAGRWAAEKDFRGDLKPNNDETRAWMEAAAAIFSRCLFGPLSGPPSHSAEPLFYKKETLGHEGYELPVKSIAIDALIDFERFIFPGRALFARAAFENSSRFGGVKFLKEANFTGMRPGAPSI